jgi:GT2 family glycosyltransferase
MRPGVAVIVVNYNAGEALERCIGAVLRQAADFAAGPKVTVVDNASTDGSADRVEAAFGARPGFSLLRNADNPGFGAAVNRAARSAGFGAESAAAGAAPEYLLLLNPDCELQAGALDLLCTALDSDPGAGLAAPRVTDERGEVLRGTLRRFPDPWRSFVTFSGLWRLGRRWPLFRGVEQSDELPAAAVPAEAVSGACMLVRRSAFAAAGGMDEGYRLHCEDLDLMYRLRQAGLHCLFVPQAWAIHHQGLSSARRPLWVHWQKHRGMQRFFRKFQADRHPRVLRWFVAGGIWTRFVLTSPPVLWRSLRRAFGPSPGRP